MQSDSAGDALDGGAAEAVGSALPLRKRQQKVPVNTYVRPGTQQRMKVLKDRGYAVTDIVDAATSSWTVPGCPRPVSSDLGAWPAFPARLPLTGPFARWVAAVQARP